MDRLQFFEALLTGDLTSTTSTFIFALRHVNRYYYLYRRSKALPCRVEGDALAEPVPIYNNIRNGLGIFGGYNQSNRGVRLI